MIKFINERELAEGLLNDKKLINDSTLPRIRAYIKLLKQKAEQMLVDFGKMMVVIYILI